MQKLVSRRPAPAIPAEKRARRAILLTGFGPFPGMPENATSHIVPEVAKAARSAFPGYEVHWSVLPTEWRAAPSRLAALHEDMAPELSLHLGVSSMARGFEIEARARNVTAPHIDAAGELPPSDRLASDAPEFLAAALPTRLLVERLRRQGLPAYLSWDAGTYLCNALLYHALLASRRAGGPRRVGFVHIPAWLVERRRAHRRRHPDMAPLDRARAVAGTLEIIAGALARPRVG
ncbi:MAG: pyroglutamyl-peptidase I [Hyphomicrobiaceae bacterium]